MQNTQKYINNVQKYIKNVQKYIKNVQKKPNYGELTNFSSIVCLRKGLGKVVKFVKKKMITDFIYCV